MGTVIKIILGNNEIESGISINYVLKYSDCKRSYVTNIFLMLVQIYFYHKINL